MSKRGKDGGKRRDHESSQAFFNQISSHNMTQPLAQRILDKIQLLERREFQFLETLVAKKFTKRARLRIFRKNNQETSTRMSCKSSGANNTCLRALPVVQGSNAKFSKM